MPVAVRPDVPLTVEAVLKLSESIRRKERELIARERQADKDEQNIKLLFEDLKVERAELTAIAESIETKLGLARDKLDELKLESQDIAIRMSEIEKAAKRKGDGKGAGEAGLDEIDERVKIAKPWFEGLAEDQAANYLKEFANNGELEFAARLLKSLQQRQGSKILAAFDDPDFAQQILNSLAPSENDSNEKTDDDTANRDSGSSFR